ncbi:hypothetical protein [Noviherbaspirillum aerium]|uniref:hypothetical protein n=1 Tax=Noviherbaspirillum aerium TaxID=2588497 RepID=UPI00124EB590|nr:hypothetical protein [Noviherbaspirillum aerium]
MIQYPDIETFLQHLVNGIESGQYTKATFPKALDEQGWKVATSDLVGKNSAVKESLIEPLQYIGVLPAKSTGKAFTHDDLSKGIASRLELIKFAKAHIKDFTSVQH